VLKDKARAFARLAPAQKAALIRESMAALEKVAAAWVEDACRAKGISADGPAAGEEWLAGGVCTMRNLRLAAKALDEIAHRGQPALDDRQIRRRPDGRTEVRVFPGDGIDGALFAGFTASELMMPGLGADEVRARQASFYGQKDPEGGVSLILGAGNVSSI